MMIADRVLTLILRRADRGVRLLVISGAGLMVAVVSIQVIVRYIFNDSLDWADEVSRIAFVWTIFLAIPLGIRDGTHVGIEILVKRFPNKLQKIVSCITNILAAGLMLIIFWGSIMVTIATWSERLGSLNITSSVFFFPITLCALHSALHLIQIAVFPPESSI